MTAAALVMDLRARGVTLVADGGTLRCRPKSALTDEDLAALRLLKSEVLAALTRPATSNAKRVVCFSCKCDKFWLSIYGVRICSVCHPPAAPDLVATWLEPGA